MSSAGKTNSHPMMVSRRTTLLSVVRRENAKATARWSDVTVDSTVSLSGAGIVPRPLLLLTQFPQVFGLDGLQEPGSVLLAADHLLELGRPALSEDRTGRVGNKVHRGARLANNGARRERVVRDRARRDRWYRGVRRPTGVRATHGHIDLPGIRVGGDPVQEERGAVRVLSLGRYAIGQRGGHGRRAATGLRGRHHEEADVAGQVLVVARVLPVTVEGEDTLALTEPGSGVRV